MTDTDPRIEDHYDDLAEHWATIVSGPERADGVWPAVEEMLPDLDGQRVLDAGCGAGVYSAWLDERGAEVFGVDASEAMLAEARERVPAATFEQADLSEPLAEVPDDSVDVVLCQHVFSHLDDLSTPLSTFARVLRSGGTLVVTTHNPVFDYVVVRDGAYPETVGHAHLDPTVEIAGGGPRYSRTERFDVHWTDEAASQRATYFRRPFENLVTPVLDAGFSLDSVVEPGEGQPNDADGEGRDYPPEALCLRATRSEP